MGNHYKKLAQELIDTIEETTREVLNNPDKYDNNTFSLIMDLSDRMLTMSMHYKTLDATQPKRVITPTLKPLCECGSGKTAMNNGKCHECNGIPF